MRGTSQLGRSVTPTGQKYNKTFYKKTARAQAGESRPWGR
jgi:hypothetical protein